MKRILSLMTLMVALAATAADGIRLEKVEYPFPVSTYKFMSQNLDLEMIYMDIPARNPGAQVVVLLHGKNFSGAYWRETAIALRDSGYRVIIPDQIGFGKSTKPDVYHYSFSQLASNTRQLLASLQITNAHIMGHSMGGMLATRYALMYPQETRNLILVAPIGLEDWRSKGVPYLTIDQWYQDEMRQTPELVRAYQKESYYHGTWVAQYEPWLDMQLNFLRSPQFPRMAWSLAVINDMIYSQPVCYEFRRVQVPVLLMVGLLDRTAIGKKYVTPEVGAVLGNYATLGREAAQTFPRCQLVEFDDLGHLPHIEAFQRFITPVKTFLNGDIVRTQAKK